MEWYLQRPALKDFHDYYHMLNICRSKYAWSIKMPLLWNIKLTNILLIHAGINVDPCLKGALFSVGT